MLALETRSNRWVGMFWYRLRCEIILEELQLLKKIYFSVRIYAFETFYIYKHRLRITSVIYTYLLNAFEFMGSVAFSKVVLWIISHTFMDKTMIYEGGYWWINVVLKKWLRIKHKLPFIAISCASQKYNFESKYLALAHYSIKRNILRLGVLRRIEDFFLIFTLKVHIHCWKLFELVWNYLNLLQSLLLQPWEFSLHSFKYNHAKYIRHDRVCQTD